MNLTDNGIIYSQANHEDFNSIKTLMLKALKDDPFAFSVDFEEYEYNSDDWWRNYITPYFSGYKDKMFLAKKDSHVLGMVGTLFEYRTRRRHVVSIVWFYVEKESRGKGIGKELMLTALRHIKSHPEIAKIFLLVNQKQISAIELYKKLGFKQNGILEKEYKIKEEFIDTHIMEIFL